MPFSVSKLFEPVSSGLSRLKKSAAHVYADFKGAVTGEYKTQGQNGIDYTFSNCPHSKILEVEVQVNVGHHDDPENMNGLSHMVEHLVINSDYRRIIEELHVHGCQIEFFTCVGITSYKFSIPYALYNERLLIENVEKLFNPLFDAVQFENEKDVWLTERGYSSDEDKSIYSCLTTFARGKNLASIGHPDAETLSRITIEDIQSHHEKYYVGANTEIKVSGPLGDILRTAQIYRAHFDGVPVGSKKISKEPKSLSFHSGEHRINESSENVQWGIAFCTDERCVKNFRAFRVFDHYVHLRLLEELRGNRRIIYSPNVLTSFFHGVDIVSITGQSMPENSSKIMPILAKVIGEIARGEIDMMVFTAAQKKAVHYGIEEEIIESITPEDLAAIARSMTRQKPALVTIGNEGNIHSLDEFWFMLQKELVITAAGNENIPVQSIP